MHEAAMAMFQPTADELRRRTDPRTEVVARDDRLLSAGPLPESLVVRVSAYSRSPPEDRPTAMTAPTAVVFVTTVAFARSMAASVPHHRLELAPTYP